MLRRVILALGLLVAASLPALATEADLYCLNPNQTSGQDRFIACGGSTTPVAVSATQATYTSSGASQFGLAITTNTTLTVPTSTKCAEIQVETANVRYTDDSTSATTSNGVLVASGVAFQYCGPLSALKFTAVSGSPTINVAYYK